MNQKNKYRISKDEYFMKIAKVVSERSTCIKRKVGAVLVKDSHILSTGYNGAPSGFKHCTTETCVRKNLKSGERPELCRGVHAEINCVSDNSLIISNSGEIMEAKDIGKKIFAVNEHLKVIPSDAEKFLSIKDKLIKIKTAGNYELLVSEDHLMFKMDDEEGLKEIKASNLSLNDYLPIVTYIPIKGIPQELPNIEYDSFKLNNQGIKIFCSKLQDMGLSQNCLAQNLGFSRTVIRRLLSGEGIKDTNFTKIAHKLGLELNNYKMGVERKKVFIPSITSCDLCQIVGYFIGDGTLGNNFISFFDKNRLMLEHYNELIKKVFGITGNIRKNKDENQYILNVSSKRLSLFFEKLGIGISEKKIPKLFHKVDNDSLSFLLRGLFDAEGMVRFSPRKLVALTSGFIRILEIVRLLLLRFGILSSLYQLKRTVKISDGAGSYSYVLSTSGEDLLKYKKYIGFSHPIKKEKLEKIKKVGLSKKRCYPKYYFSSRISTTKWSTLRDRRSEVINQITANKIVNELKLNNVDKKVLYDLVKLTESNISFVKIKELVNVRKSQKMIDFYVPDYNSFIANGILVHNCIIQAALHGTSIKGDTTLYTTIFPCMTCLKLVINAGIKKIVYLDGYNMENEVKKDLLNESVLIVKPLLLSKL